MKFGEGDGGLGGILESLHLSVHVSGFSLNSISRAAQPFDTKLGMEVHYHESE